MVRDPVCGMEIKPEEAIATRKLDGKEFYFCSESCIKKFDANPHQYIQNSSRPAGSANTGFNPNSASLQIELPIIGFAKEGQPGRALIHSAFNKMAGIERVVANPIEEVVMVEYDPKAIQIMDIVNTIKKTGYQVGGAQKRIGIESIRCSSCLNQSRYSGSDC
jgi:Cu+-exporting ATPase